MQTPILLLALTLAACTPSSAPRTAFESAEAPAFSVPERPTPLSPDEPDAQEADEAEKARARLDEWTRRLGPMAGFVAFSAAESAMLSMAASQSPEEPPTPVVEDERAEALGMLFPFDLWNLLRGIVVSSLETVQAAVARAAEQSAAACAESAPESSGAQDSGDALRSELAGDAYEMWMLELDPTLHTRIVVTGDGSSDLDAYLICEHGNQIASEESLHDSFSVEIAPQWSGEFVLLLVNRGEHSNSYELRVE